MQSYIEQLIEQFNLNINRIRKANKFFKTNKGSKKAEDELDYIIRDCNSICIKLKDKGFDISQLDMDIT